MESEDILDYIDNRLVNQSNEYCKEILLYLMSELQNRIDACDDCCYTD